MIAQVAASRSVIRDYVALGKPRIVLLLLFTALAGMFLASGGPPELTLTIVVLGGGAMASAGANALNQFLDRDIDARMRRTSDRPVATNRVHPREALLFGTGLNVVAFVLFTTLVNPLSALLTLSATLFYVFVYTMALKRTTPQNIVIGGAAGALPPMIGWTAVTGSLGLPAVYLFAIIFFWTPPHFWALSLALKGDYAAARVPMLPVIASDRTTGSHIILYIALLLALSWLPVAGGYAGLLYATTATVLGLEWLRRSLPLISDGSAPKALSSFKFSLLYLVGVFLILALEPALPGY